MFADCHWIGQSDEHKRNHELCVCSMERDSCVIQCHIEFTSAIKGLELGRAYIIKTNKSTGYITIDQATPYHRRRIESETFSHSQNKSRSTPQMKVGKYWNRFHCLVPASSLGMVHTDPFRSVPSYLKVDKNSTLENEVANRCLYLFSFTIAWFTCIFDFWSLYTKRTL